MKKPNRQNITSISKNAAKKHPGKHDKEQKPVENPGFEQYPETNPAKSPVNKPRIGDPEKGNDIRSQQQPQQQQQGRSVVDEIKGKWKQQVGAAKVAWGELTEDELLKSEGQFQKLTGLVQERYAITRSEAEKQVKGFFDTHKL